MVIIKSFVSAISLFSKIPMPSLDYKEGDDRYSLCFFPVVGLVLCFFVCGLVWLLQYMEGVNRLDGKYWELIVTLVYIMLPVALTGGIHVDGFVDTMDAMHSYGNIEKKLEILKDPHIGAFGVIKLLELVGIWIVGLMIAGTRFMPLAALGFIISRAMSGISVIMFRPAKPTGMLVYEKSSSARKVSIVVLFLWILITWSIGVLRYGVMGVAIIVASTFCFVYYRYRANKEFGGVTGDTSGCFLVLTETTVIVLIAALSLVI